MTPQERKVFELALEAFKEINYDQAYSTEITAIKEALAQPDQYAKGNWINAEDVSRNVKALDIALNGEGAASNPLLIDVLGQVQAEARRIGMPVLKALAQPEQCRKEKHENGEYVCNCKAGECPQFAQPEQEPVAWMDDYNACKCPDNEARCFSDKVFRMMQKHTDSLVKRQEPVAKVCHDLDGHIGWNPNLKQLPNEGTPLYTTPPQPDHEAIAAIREALAQKEHEPHSWYSKQEDEWMTHKTRKEHERLNSYTHKVGKFDLALYTTPPPRKPLTDEQKMALCKQFPDHLTFNAIHAIEAAHNIKE